jgi:hypothetical protein
MTNQSHFQKKPNRSNPSQTDTTHLEARTNTHLEHTMSPWPPDLTDEQAKTLARIATTYSLSHGMIHLHARPIQPRIPGSAIYAPLTLLPAPFPRPLFQMALRLQRIYNILYSRIAMDEEFLDDIFNTDHGIGEVDDYVGQLWKGWKQLRDEGVAQVSSPFFAKALFGMGISSVTYPVSRVGSFLSSDQHFLALAFRKKKKFFSGLGDLSGFPVLCVWSF